jgi:hypothetical protein
MTLMLLYVLLASWNLIKTTTAASTSKGIDSIQEGTYNPHNMQLSAANAINKRENISTGRVVKQKL